MNKLAFESFSFTRPGGGLELRESLYGVEINKSMKRYIKRIDEVDGFLPETPLNIELNSEKRFIEFCIEELELASLPTIEKVGVDWSRANGSFACWSPAGITVVCDGRHPMDWMRSLAHELVHHRQWERDEELDGSTGSQCENEANAWAGIIMRKWKDVEENNCF